MSNEQTGAKYKFIGFNDILLSIRDSFLTELESAGLLSNIDLSSKLYKKILRHCVLEEILKTYVKIDFFKINVILIDHSQLSVCCDELFDSEKFVSMVLLIIDQSKKKIPILIKKYNKNIPFDVFLKTGDGIQFLMEIEMDSVVLKQRAGTFKDFKAFSKKNGLRYINKILIEDNQFKRLFLS